MSDIRQLRDGRVLGRGRDILQMLPKIRVKAGGFQQEWVGRGEGVSGFSLAPRMEQAEQACSRLESTGPVDPSAGALWRGPHWKWNWFQRLLIWGR